MKKLACLGVLLCLALGLFIALPTSTRAQAEESDTIVIYVYDEQEWDLHAYCYAGGAAFGPAWPGVELEPAPEMGENWFSFELPADPTGKTVRMIIFDNNNNLPNRMDVPYNASNIYFNTFTTTKGFASKEATVSDAIKNRPKLVETIYVYNYSIDDKEERWESLYATCYNGKTGELLGEGSTLAPATDIGEHWYKYDLPEEAKSASEEDYKFRARIVVNNGETGRERLAILAPVEATKYYNTYREYGFTTAKIASDDEFNCVYSDPKTGTTRLYYYNSQRWKTVYAYAYWTYTAANNTNVEDFGSFPGKAMKELEDHENWYYIDLPQDVKKRPVGIAINANTKGRTKEDSYITDPTKVYINYDGALFSSFAACESNSTLIPPLPDINDYLLDFDSIDTTEKTITVYEYRDGASYSLTAPIVVLSLAGAVCIAVGAVLIIFTVRRKQK